MTSWSLPPSAPPTTSSAPSRGHGSVDGSDIKSAHRSDDPWRKPGSPGSSREPDAATSTLGCRTESMRVKLPSINDMMRDAPAVGACKPGSAPGSRRSSVMVPSPETAGPSRLYPQPAPPPARGHDFDDRAYRSSPPTQAPLTAGGAEGRMFKEAVPDGDRYPAPRRPLEAGPVLYDHAPPPHHPVAYSMPQLQPNPYSPPRGMPWSPYGHAQYEVAPPYGGVVYVPTHAPMLYNGGDGMMAGPHMGAASNAVRSLQNIPAPLLQPPRPRVSLACQFCRSRKLRCSQGPGPCDHCTRRGRECVFESTRQPKGGQPRGSDRQHDERGASSSLASPILSSLC